MRGSWRRLSEGGWPVRLVRYGESAEADYRITGYQPDGMSTEFERAGPWRRGAGPAAGGGARAAQRAERDGGVAMRIAVELGLTRSGSRPGWRGTAARSGGWRSRARSARSAY